MREHTRDILTIFRNYFKNITRVQLMLQKIDAHLKSYILRKRKIYPKQKSVNFIGKVALGEGR